MDYGFIRFLPDFTEAKKVTNLPHWELADYSFLSLRTNEFYTMITASSVPINFDNDYKVEVVDLCGNVLEDISSVTTIFDFTDKFGIPQAVIEIISFGNEYANAVCLKLTHTMGVDVFYSNPFRVTFDEYSLRIAFSNNGFYSGTDYTNAPYMQYMRFSGFLGGLDDSAERDEYRQVDGNVFTSTVVPSFTQKLTVDRVPAQLFEALSVALKHGVVFIEGYRVTNKPILKGSDIQGNTFLQGGEAALVFDKSVKLTERYQVTQYLQIVEKFPIGTINEISSDTEKIKLNFNKPVTVGVGSFIIRKSTGAIVASLTESDFEVTSPNIISSKDFITDYTGSDFDSYYITFTYGLFLSGTESLSISNNTDWIFNIGEGFYDPIYYDNNYYTT